MQVAAQLADSAPPGSVLGLGHRGRPAQRVKRGAGAGRRPSTMASPCCASCRPDRAPTRPRPVRWAGRAGRSGRGDVDRDGDAVRDHVEHRRPAPRLLDECGQLLRLGVALDVEDHPDGLVAVADVSSRPRIPSRLMSPSTVAVTSSRSMPRAAATLARPLIRHAPRALRSSSAGVGALSAPTSTAGWSASMLRHPLVEVFLAGAVEPMDGALVVGAADPAVGGAELEAGDLWLGPDGVEGGEQGLDVDAVPGARKVGDGHGDAFR